METMWLFKLVICCVIFQQTFCDIPVTNEQTQAGDGSSKNTGQDSQDSGIVHEHQNHNHKVNKDPSTMHTKPQNLDPKAFKSQIDSTVVSENNDKERKTEEDSLVFAVPDGEFFEEDGKPDESLVDQMNRLSEKIKKSQENKPVEEMTVASNTEKNVNHKSEKRNNLNDPASYSDPSGHSTTKDAGIEPKLGTPDEGTLPQNLKEVNNEIKEEIPVAHSNNQRQKESVTEQIKKISKDIDVGNIRMPKIEQPDDEEGTFPKDNELDFVGEDLNLNSKTKVQTQNSKVGIENTLAPSSHIHHNVQATKNNEPVVQTNNAKKERDGDVDVRVTPTIEELKNTISDTVLETIKDERILTTTHIPEQQTRQVYDGKTKKNLRMEKQKRQQSSSSDHALKATEVHIESSEKKLEASVTDNTPENLHLSATLVAASSHSVKMTQSEEKVTEYETQTEPQAQVKEILEKQKEEKEEVVPTATKSDTGKQMGMCVGLCYSGI